jgi:hypothetical protein
VNVVIACDRGERSLPRDAAKQARNRHFKRFAGNGPIVADAAAMSFAAVANRVRSEFLEMPGLELTMPQAVRLWNLGQDDCRAIVDSLVDAGFLRWTPKRTIIWSGRDQAPSRRRQMPTFLSGVRETASIL